MGQTWLSTYPRRLPAWVVLRELGITVAVVASVLLIGLLIHHLGGGLPLEQRFSR